MQFCHIVIFKVIRTHQWQKSCNLACSFMYVLCKCSLTSHRCSVTSIVPTTPASIKSARVFTHIHAICFVASQFKANKISNVLNHDLVHLVEIRFLQGKILQIAAKPWNWWKISPTKFFCYTVFLLFVTGCNSNDIAVNVWVYQSCPLQKATSSR